MPCCFKGDCRGYAQVRCLVDIPGSQPPKDLKDYLVTVVAPQLPHQLEEAFLRGLASGLTRSMTNKLMPAAPRHHPGALLLGDAFNMRHPLTGAPMPSPPSTSLAA